MNSLRITAFLFCLGDSHYRSRALLEIDNSLSTISRRSRIRRWVYYKEDQEILKKHEESISNAKVEYLVSIVTTRLIREFNRCHGFRSFRSLSCAMVVWSKVVEVEGPNGSCFKKIGPYVTTVLLSTIIFRFSRCNSLLHLVGNSRCNFSSSSRTSSRTKLLRGLSHR